MCMLISFNIQIVNQRLNYVLEYLTIVKNLKSKII